MNFFQDLLGNAAIAGGNMLGKQVDREQQAAILQQQREADHDFVLQRQEALDALRAQRAQTDMESKQKRLSDQNAAVDSATPGVTQARQMAEFQKAAPSGDAATMGIVKSKLSPAQMAQYYGVDDSALASIGDQTKVARDKGFYELEAGFKDQRNSVIKQMIEERKAADTTRRLNQKDDQLLESARKTDATTATALAAIASRKDIAADKLDAKGERAVASEKLTTEKSNALREITMLNDIGPSRWSSPDDLKNAMSNLSRINKALSSKRDPDGAPTSALPITPGTKIPSANFNGFSATLKK